MLATSTGGLRRTVGPSVRHEGPLDLERPRWPLELLRLDFRNGYDKRGIFVVSTAGGAEHSGACGLRILHGEGAFPRTGGVGQVRLSVVRGIGVAGIAGETAFFFFFTEGGRGKNGA